MVKKHVTFFALHLDSHILTQNLSSYYQIRYSGSGQILQLGQFYHSLVPIAIGIAKIALWSLACRDFFRLKYQVSILPSACSGLCLLKHIAGPLRSIARETKHI
jgi:hypothetical protein